MCTSAMFISYVHQLCTSEYIRHRVAVDRNPVCHLLYYMPMRSARETSSVTAQQPAANHSKVLMLERWVKIVIIFAPVVTMGAFFMTRHYIVIPAVISIYEKDDISEKYGANEKNSDKAAGCEKQKPDRQDPVQETAAPYLCLLPKQKHCRKISGRRGGRRIYLRGRRDAHSKRMQ